MCDVAYEKRSPTSLQSLGRWAMLRSPRRAVGPADESAPNLVLSTDAGEVEVAEPLVRVSQRF